MIDISVMSNEELSKIVAEANEELTKRRYVQKEQAWNRVRDAIADYLDKYELIEIKGYEECITLEKRYTDLSEIGAINSFNR